MFAKRRADSAKQFRAAKAKAHAKNHAKAHEAAGNIPAGSVVSKPAVKAQEKPVAKAAQDGCKQLGAK